MKKEERKLRVREAEEELRKEVAEFKELLGADQDFASRFSSVLGVECSLGRQVSPLVASAPVPVDSAHASSRVRGTTLAIAPEGVPAGT